MSLSEQLHETLGPTDAFLAFYIADKGNRWDKIISAIDGSPYSHVELAVPKQDGHQTYYECYTSHQAEGGVRMKRMTLDTGKWVLIPIKTDIEYAMRVFNKEKGRRYDWLGLVTTKVKWLPNSSKQWFCSELVAAMLNLKDCHNYGVKRLWKEYR